MIPVALASTDITQSVTTSFNDLLLRFIAVLPTIIAALLVFFLGVFIAVLLGKATERIIKLLPIDQALQRLGLGKFFERAGVKLNTGHFVGQLVKWFLIIVAILATADILELTGLVGFLKEILLYLPNIIVAALILIIAGLVAYFVDRAIVRGLAGLGQESYIFVGGIVKWAILIFGFLAALLQLRVAPDLIEVLFTGFVAMFAIAGGLAFGLGGQDTARELLERFRKDLDKKNR